MTKYFFVTGLGRSGTKFLAQLLNKADGVHVEHEPHIEDYEFLPKAYYGEDVSDYVNQRAQNIQRRYQDREDISIYGEVNSLMRYFIPQLRAEFDSVTCIHLVRDGRDVIRSMYGRGVYRGESLHVDIVPRIDEPYYLAWQHFSRFQKLCWYWMRTNEDLTMQIENCVQFEKIIGHFGYLEQQLLKRLGMVLEQREWERLKSVQIGRSSMYALPRWDDWNGTLRRQFQEICGEAMVKLGYTEIYP